MNSFDSAVGKRLAKFISDDVAEHKDVITAGIASDFLDYQVRCARVKAFEEVLEQLKSIEQELIAG